MSSDPGARESLLAAHCRLQRQPRRLFLLPFQAVVVVLAAYTLWTPNPSVTLSLVIGGIVIFCMVFEGTWLLVAHVMAGYRAPTSKPE